MKISLPEHLLRVILLDNPWLEGAPIGPWQSRYLPEKYIHRTLNLKADHRICLVVGPRQAGKSTLLWKTLAQSGKPFLYLNCEEPVMREWLQSPAEFLGGIATLAGEDTPVLFEEIQHLSDAGLFLKGIADRRTGRQFYATGSSTFDLEAKTRESLAGRAIRNLLLPLSLREAMSGSPSTPAQYPFVLQAITEKLTLYGGYPSVFVSDSLTDQLTGLVEAFIIRDASDRLRIAYPAAFRKLMQLIASQIGNLCNFSEWASICGISADAIREYTGILENSHIIRLIRPFVGGKRAEITSTPKAYFLDNGIRNQVFGGFSSLETRSDAGSLAENFVFTELCKASNPLLDTIRFWRSKSGAEVDFVLEHQGKLSAFEVKSNDSRRKLTRSARSFIDAYQPERFCVVSQQDYPFQKIGATLVSFISFSRIAEQVHIP